MSERNGKPSASGMSRLALCPGSWNLESSLPPKEENKYMALGTAVHAVLADQKAFEELSEEGQEIATRCLSAYADMINQLDLGTITSSVIEERFWYDELFSGAIDRIDFFGDEIAVVTDYKTGRTAQSNAAENLQLRAYAILVKKAYPKLKRIIVAIIQPLAGGTTLCEYEDIDLHIFEKEIVGIVNACQDTNAPRIPSPDACKWCAGKDICPERNGKAQADTQELQIFAANTIVEMLSDQELVILDDKAEIVEDFIADIRQEIKTRLQFGKQIDGRKLGKGRITRSVPDSVTAASTLSGILKPDEFLACTKVSISSLEKAYAKAKGIKSKESKEALQEALGWLIETKEGEPSVIKC